MQKGPEVTSPEKEPEPVRTLLVKAYRRHGIKGPLWGLLAAPVGLLYNSRPDGRLARIAAKLTSSEKARQEALNDRPPSTRG